MSNAITDRNVLSASLSNHVTSCLGVAGREAVPPATRTRPEADGPGVARHGGVLQRSVRLAARAEEQPRRIASLHTHAEIHVRMSVYFVIKHKHL